MAQIAKKKSVNWLKIKDIRENLLVKSGAKLVA